MIETSRRSLITGLVALVAAPAIVKVASLMPINASLQPARLVTLNEITREAVRLFVDSNLNFVPSFVERVNAAYCEQFAAGGAKVGDVLRVRLSKDYTVGDYVSHPADEFQYTTLSSRRIHHETVDFVPDKLALAAAACVVAPMLLEKPVTRRFWG